MSRCGSPTTGRKHAPVAAALRAEVLAVRIRADFKLAHSAWGVRRLRSCGIGTIYHRPRGISARGHLQEQCVGLLGAVASHRPEWLIVCRALVEDGRPATAGRGWRFHVCRGR